MTIPWFRPEPIEIPLVQDVEWLPHYVEPFGLIVALGVAFGVRVALFKAQRDGIQPRVVAELCGYQLFGGFVIGHVLDSVFYHWDVVIQNPLLLVQLWNGLSSFGGFVGAAVGSLAWMRLRGYSFLAFADPIAFSFPFGWLGGRLGCFVIHDHPGAVTDFPLAVADYHVFGGRPPWLTRHDLGLYEVLWCLAMIPLFLWLGRTRRPRGFYLAILPLLYAPVRFGLDFLRATDIAGQDPRYAGLTPGHYGAVVLFVAGLLVLERVRRGPAPVVPPEAAWIPDGETPTRWVPAARLDAWIAEGARVIAEDETERGAHVRRWPGGILVVDLADADPTPDVFEEVGDELAALGPPEHVVWQLRALDEAAAGAIADARSRAPARHLVVTEEPRVDGPESTEVLEAPLSRVQIVIAQTAEGGYAFALRGVEEARRDEEE